jgi:hypothetical protein
MESSDMTRHEEINEGVVTMQDQSTAIISRNVKVEMSLGKRNRIGCVIMMLRLKQSGRSSAQRATMSSKLCREGLVSWMLLPK